MYGIGAGFAGMILANTRTVFLTFFNDSAHVQDLKNILIYKVVVDGLLAVFMGPITK